MPVLPQDLLRRCRSLRRATSAALRESSRRRSPRLQATVVSDSGFTATITVVCAASELAEPAFVIEFKRTLRRRESASRRLALTTLTGSERQVALLVAEGRSNQEASEQLGKTVHAVKFLLHRVYAKLAVSNRVQLSLLVNRKRPHTGLRTTAAAPSKNAPLP